MSRKPDFTFPEYASRYEEDIAEAVRFMHEEYFGRELTDDQQDISFVRMRDDKKLIEDKNTIAYINGHQAPRDKVGGEITVLKGRKSEGTLCSIIHELFHMNFPEPNKVITEAYGMLGARWTEHCLENRMTHNFGTVLKYADYSDPLTDTSKNDRKHQLGYRLCDSLLNATGHDFEVVDDLLRNHTYEELSELSGLTVDEIKEGASEDWRKTAAFNILFEGIIYGGCYAISAGSAMGLAESLPLLEKTSSTDPLIAAAIIGFFALAGIGTFITGVTQTIKEIKQAASELKGETEPLFWFYVVPRKFRQSHSDCKFREWQAGS